MKKILIILLLYFIGNKALANNKFVLVEDNALYTNPFPYSTEIRANNIKYKWNESSIIARLHNKSKIKYCEKLVKVIPNVIYDFKKNFFKNSENYFKYLIENEVNNNINNRNNYNFNPLKYHKGVLETYCNPFDKNPFIFKIGDDIFQWKNSQIFIKDQSNVNVNKLKNILTNFNDSSYYFTYTLRKALQIQSLKINIEYNKNIKKDYKSLTLEDSIENPFDDYIVVIKDCVRTCRWYDDTVEILSPDWLNDNLSKNNYKVFIQLLKKATNDFCKSEYNKLDNFADFIKMELGENILVYSIDTDKLDWENVNNINKHCISSVFNSNTGFVEIEKSNCDIDYDWNNDKDDF